MIGFLECSGFKVTCRTPRRGDRFVGKVVPIADPTPGLGSDPLHSRITDAKEIEFIASPKTSCEVSSTKASIGDPDYDQLIGRETGLQILMAEYPLALCQGATPTQNDVTNDAPVTNAVRQDAITEPVLVGGRAAEHRRHP